MVGRTEIIEIPEEIYLQILKIVSRDESYNNVTEFVVSTLHREIQKVMPGKKEEQGPSEGT